MKNLILTSLLFLMTSFVYGQCNCKTLNRENGTKAVICAPLPIAGDNGLEIGIGAMYQQNSNYVSLTIRFKSIPVQKINSNLFIRLKNNDLITLEYFNGQLGYYGGSQVAQAIFITKNTQAAKLQNSALLTISFKLTDGLMRAYKIQMNGNALEKQLKCVH